jgi:regulatory protein
LSKVVERRSNRRAPDKIRSIMPVIITLEKIKRQKGWFELKLDDGTTFPVNDELILKHVLKAGESYLPGEIKVIRERAEYLYVKKKAYDILSRRRLSEKDLRRKLKSEKRYARVADRVVEDLKEQRLIDDLDYASALIQSAIATGSRSKRYIKKKLYEKGVPAEISDKAVEDELADYDEADAAMKLAAKKYKSVKTLPELKAKKRIADFLRSRGFNWDAINNVLNKLFRPEE